MVVRGAFSGGTLLSRIRLGGEAHGLTQETVAGRPHHDDAVARLRSCFRAADDGDGPGRLPGGRQAAEDQADEG